MAAPAAAAAPGIKTTDKDMKKYIKPTIKAKALDMESLLASESGFAKTTTGFEQEVDPSNPGDVHAGANGHSILGKKSLFSDDWNE